ncbi:unnamed protein product [Caenorhabditis angaria]|uniref:ANK_REP_REGION domain-containing protein n=1 Tax=Caenorhabditis angaria TaxID=860376 RepID=A0A9P1NA77_9PELO|nr:unnamed protein product [Caenorhabditis angaria]
MMQTELTESGYSSQQNSLIETELESEDEDNEEKDDLTKYRVWYDRLLALREQYVKKERGPFPPYPPPPLKSTMIAASQAIYINPFDEIKNAKVENVDQLFRQRDDQIYSHRFHPTDFRPLPPPHVFLRMIQTLAPHEYVDLTYALAGAILLEVGVRIPCDFPPLPPRIEPFSKWRQKEENEEAELRSNVSSQSSSEGEYSDESECTKMRVVERRMQNLKRREERLHRILNNHKTNAETEAEKPKPEEISYYLNYKQRTIKEFIPPKPNLRNNYHVPPENLAMFPFHFLSAILDGSSFRNPRQNPQKRGEMAKSAAEKSKKLETAENCAEPEAEKLEPVKIEKVILEIIPPKKSSNSDQSSRKPPHQRKKSAASTSSKIHRNRINNNYLNNRSNYTSFNTSLTLKNADESWDQMPKDKEKLVVKTTTKKGKKDDDDEKKKEKVKRRHSLTDYSTTSSSSSSSSSSSNSSTASESSFSSSIDEFEKNKGTMTTPPPRNVKSDSSDSEKKDVPGPSNPTTTKNNNKKKNQKERKLTKKEKKLANEQQQNQQQHGQLNASAKKVIEAAIHHTPPPTIQFETFGNYGDDSDDAVGKMLVRGVNEAAKQALGGDEIQMPFYSVRQTEPTSAANGEGSSSSAGAVQPPEQVQHDFDGQNHYHTYFEPDEQLPKLDLLDGHQLGQEKYLRTKKLRYYDSLNDREKVRERMGFGIAGTGLKDRMPKTLSLQNANHILRYTYSQLIEKSFNMENWRQQFGAHLLQESYHREPRHKELEKYMRSQVDRLVSEEPDAWKRTTMEAVLVGDLELVVQRIAEMDRMLVRKDIEGRRMGLDSKCQRFDEKTHEQRFQHCVDVICSWMVVRYMEKVPAAVHGRQVSVLRGVSVLMYLASAGDREIMCMRNAHKKCTMMAFLLCSMSPGVRRDLMLLSATNGLTALHFCAMTGWPCQLDILLKYGASTEIMTDNWQTPMCFAARRNCTLMARQLMWHGADLSVLQRFGYSATVAMSGYISRKFIDDRQMVLQDVYDSFLNAYLSECDERIELRMFKRHSLLQTCRISETVADKYECQNMRIVLIKNMDTCIQRNSPSDSRPIGLFLIPVMYTPFDSTMKAYYPHVVKVPLYQNAAKIAASCKTDDYSDDEEYYEEDEEDEEEDEEEEEEEEHEPPVVEQARISKLMAKRPVLTIGQGDGAKEIELLPFFNHEHNGNIYSYTMPQCFSQVSPGTPAALTLYISQDEARYFENTFFLWQIVEITPNYTVRTIDEDDEIYERERLGIVREKMSEGLDFPQLFSIFLPLQKCCYNISINNQSPTNNFVRKYANFEIAGCFGQFEAFEADRMGEMRNSGAGNCCRAYVSDGGFGDVVGRRD